MATQQVEAETLPVDGPPEISPELAEAINEAGDITFVTPRHEMVLVTPEIAARWLATNPRNRTLRRNKVDEYAMAMKEGKWNFDGQPIRRGVTEEGREILLDGQHRLHAILESEVPQLMSTWRFIKIEAQDTMDIGLKRMAGDSLKMRGEKNTAALAGALALTLRWERGIRGPQLGSNAAAGTVQIQDQIKFLEDHPDFRDGVVLGGRIRYAVGGRVPISVLATGYFIMSNLGTDEAENDATMFFALLESGIGLGEGSPILALRSQWARAARDSLRMSTSYYLAQLIKAWNMYRDNESAQRILWKNTGPNPEPYPEPH